MYFVIIYLFITYIYLFHHSFIYLKTHHQLFISWSIYCGGLFISSLFYLFQNSPTFFSCQVYLLPGSIYLFPSTLLTNGSEHDTSSRVKLLWLVSWGRGAGPRKQAKNKPDTWMASVGASRLYWLISELIYGRIKCIFVTWVLIHSISHVLVYKQ